ncbi:MAG: hypothetical protein Q7R89_01405 [bacterium]|nr:hypothetical protein [bacterium]
MRSKQFLVSMAIIILAVLTYFIWLGPGIDRAEVAKITDIVTWVENYYVLNSKYPTNDEFYSQFPEFIDEWNDKYNEFYSSGSDQDFFISYGLGSWKEKPYAIGTPLPREFPEFVYSELIYGITPCARWSKFGLSEPQISMYVLPGGLLMSDIDSGEVFYEQKNNKKVLLSNLLKPRIFYGADWRHPVITDGSEIYSYVYNENEIELIKDKKIADFDQRCPEPYLN